MRRPTPLMVLYRWHTAAMRGQAPEIHEGEPQAGWFRTRLVKAGPWVPARIWWEQPIDPETGELAAPEVMRGEIGDEPRSPEAVWERSAGHPISKAQWIALKSRHAADPIHQATHARVDLSRRSIRP